MGVEPKIGGILPPKWMVKIMDNPMNKWDDLGGFTPIFGNTKTYIIRKKSEENMKKPHFYLNKCYHRVAVQCFHSVQTNVFDDLLVQKMAKL